MTNPRWEEQGIPPGYASPRLYYNPPTQTLIVHVRWNGEGFCPSRLLWRHKDGSKYQQLGSPGEDIWQEPPVVSATQPVLFFNSLRCKPNAEGLGCDWEGTYLYDLGSHTLSCYVSRDAVSLPGPYISCRISALISLSGDGKVLFIIVGGVKEAPWGTRCDYFLAEMSLQTKEIRPVSLLRGVFF